MTDTYGEQLANIVIALHRAGFSPSLRGDGAARFVFVEEGDRAAEIYAAETGFLVELFEEPADASVRTCEAAAPESAVETATAWLSRKEPKHL